MKVGYVTDYLGKVVFEARAPVAGVVLYICAVPSMTKRRHDCECGRCCEVRIIGCGALVPPDAGDPVRALINLGGGSRRTPSAALHTVDLHRDRSSDRRSPVIPRQSRLYAPGDRVSVSHRF